MSKKILRKLFSRSSKLPATAPQPSAANAPPHSTPHSTLHSRFENFGSIDANNKQNCNNVSIIDNSVDNRVDPSVTIINHYYNERSKGSLQKVHFMVPYSSNEGFIGISQTLAWLEEKIKGGRDNHYRVALWGMGGVGKTQDVLECIYHYQSNQQLSVFWIHAGSQLRFEKDYRKLAELAGLVVSDDVKQDIRSIVKNWLEGPTSGNWILVLDNADNQLDFFKPVHTDIDATGDNGLADFIPHGSKGMVIITTRDREVAARLVGPCNILDKTVMDSTHARQLFIQNYPKATEYTGNEDNSISLLLEALQYLPLAIAQVAAYLCHNTLLLPSEYLNLFKATKDDQKSLLSKPFSDIRRENQSETVLATFSISFRQLQQQSPLSSSLLQLMACIDNQCIPHELLAYSIEEDDRITHLQLAEALSKLIAFGLLSTSRQGKDYEMHSLVHISINSYISAEEKDTAVKQMVGAFRRIYPKLLSESYDTCTLYLSHASALENYIKGTYKDRLFMYTAMSLLFLSVGNFSAAEEKAKQAAKLGTDILGSEHPDTLTAFSNLATIYRKQGHLKEAKELGIQDMLRWRRGCQRRRRSNSSAKRTAKERLTCVYMSHECDHLTHKRFYRFSEIKADALAHAELYQCNKCWKRFGKLYSFTRHTGNERPKYCRVGEKAKGATLLKPVDHEQLRRMTSSKTWHELVDAVYGDWRFAYEERITESNLSRVSSGNISSEITPDNEDDRVSAETLALLFSTQDYVSLTAIGSTLEEQWELLHHDPPQEFYISDAMVHSLTYA